ncbi:cytochrome P450 81Q32-like [Jatropha curcas]|uniref:cytochrome P450 81Q32-like n=1 Tax=Jatropha curcas TaxID=180498 RepID=UPI0018950041|nr:cytochrome P450 81Q32-like [Jatropha curcas]
MVRACYDFQRLPRSGYLWHRRAWASWSWACLASGTHPEFGTGVLGVFSGIRTEEVRLLLKQLFQDSRKEPAKVALTSKFLELTFNNIMRMIAGKRYYGKNVMDQGGEFLQDIIKEMEALRGSSNLNDYFPVLQWVDYQGVEKRMQKLMKKMDSFLQQLIEEHMKTRGDSSPPVNLSAASNQKKHTTLIDVMLSLKETEPEFYTDQTIKGVILQHLTAGSTNISSYIDWHLNLPFEPFSESNQRLC